ncbi:hypothetical protein CSZ94_14305 [Janthinobacterium sp. ROICE36]|uniref:hypothetical protein n=1 Tax=Janthinobacterium sp. ROICE36 TaxID=2048670 RepID=UPI000C7EC179|nr:hypothetical protein [Janthinobacterium sp. ROICE36]PLY41680.1 hypothetical protein CSZ94_14305 [Janthinobacterium sp. ROICE36]
MNAVTEAESNAIATLPPAARAALALSSTKTETALRELIKASASIVTVTNKAGREECHTAYMKLKNSRVAVGHTAADATEDAKKFTAAVKTEAARLVEIISAEETRLQLLRDGFDAIEEKRKADELAAEMDRIAAIASALQGIRERGTDAAFIDKTAAATQASIDNLEAMQITDTIYQERLAEAVELKAATLAQMLDILAVRVAAEAAEAQRLADIAAADKLRAEQAEENARVAAKNQRIAAENEAAAQKLADQQAALDLAARQQREQAEAAAKAEEVRRAEVARLEQVERNRAAAEAQAKIDAELAKLAVARQALADEQAAAEQRKADALAVEQMAARVVADHVEALIIDQEFDDHAAAEAVRVVEVAPAPAAVTSVPTDLADAADEIYDDVSYLRDLANNSKLDVLTMISALELIDFAAARAALAAEPA